MSNDRKDSDRYRSDDDRSRQGGAERGSQERGYQERGYESERPGIQDQDRGYDRGRFGEYDASRASERYGQPGGQQGVGRGYGTDRPGQYGQNRGYESGRASQGYGQERYGRERDGQERYGYGSGGYGPMPSPGGYDRGRYGAGGMDYGDYERESTRHRSGRAYEPGYSPRGDTLRGYGQDRSWWDRATDEVSSWMGDEDAERRRRLDEAHDYSGRGPRGYTRSDDRIRDDVNDRLTGDWRVDASDIDVAVSSGEITLIGSVQSRDQKRRAEDIAESVSGVKHVQNNLRVQQTSSPSMTSSAAASSGTTSSGLTGTTATPGAATSARSTGSRSGA